MPLDFAKDPNDDRVEFYIEVDANGLMHCHAQHIRHRYARELKIQSVSEYLC